MATKTYVLKGTITDVRETLIETSFIAHQSVASYYPDDTYTEGTEVTPSTGTVVVEGRMSGAQAYDTFDGSSLDATMPLTYATARAVLDKYKVTPVGISGATHYKVTFTASETN